MNRPDSAGLTDESDMVTVMSRPGPNKPAKVPTGGPADPCKSH
jgi:hypothetical protein